MIICPNCNLENPDNTVKCERCGVGFDKWRPEYKKRPTIKQVKSMEEERRCPYCKEEIQVGAIKCKNCGEILKKEEYSRLSHERTKVVRDYSDIERDQRSRAYYQKIFSEFDQNNGKFMPKWNWVAFLFGFIWYFFKGMWVKGLFMMAVTFIFWGVPFIFFWLYCGIAGNYDYYLFKVKGKQLW